MLELPDVAIDVLRQYPNAFNSAWVSQIKSVTERTGFDRQKLKELLLRVATEEISISSIFSILASQDTSASAALPSPRVRPALSLQRGNQLFAQVTPNPTKRLVSIKVPGEADIDEVAQIVHAALASRYGEKEQVEAAQH